MATQRPHAPSNHARLQKLHKRGHSAPIGLSPVADGVAYTFSRSETPTITYEESWTDLHGPMTSPTTSHPRKIKPFLRKLSTKDSGSNATTNGLDLSRPAAENDLSGLGISGFGTSSRSRSLADVTFMPVNGRHRHARSVSNTSQFSTSSGLQRLTPLISARPTPQPYTPPITRSTPPSVLGSEHEHESDDFIMSDEEFRLRQQAYGSSRRSDSFSSVPGVSSLRHHSNNSATRLAGSYSQSSLSLSSPVPQSLQARSRGDTIKSMESATSPSSRTSFDQTYRFIRGGRDSPVDPASRAATIRAARLKFEEEERAKELKYEKEAHKQQEKDLRKQMKHDTRRRKSETLDRSSNEGARSRSDSQNEKSTRPTIPGRQYSDHREAHSNALPTYVTSVDPEKQSSAIPKVTKSRAAKGTWLRFVTWLKTRLLRMSGK